MTFACSCQLNDGFRFSLKFWDNWSTGDACYLKLKKKIHVPELTYKWPVPGVQMAGSITSVLELVLEQIQELQMVGSRTSITSSRSTNGRF